MIFSHRRGTFSKTNAFLNFVLMEMAPSGIRKSRSTSTKIKKMTKIVQYFFTFAFFILNVPLRPFTIAEYLNKIYLIGLININIIKIKATI